VKAFVTGATGFIGGHLVRKLRERDDEVVALVRSPDKAWALREMGCELVQGDLGDEPAMKSGLPGCHAAFHSAAMYKVGIPSGQHPEMWEANVRGTERVLEAAVEAGVQRVVYISTVNAFGNTRGEVVDETYDRRGDGFLSYYDETKFRAHQIAQDLIEKGAPLLIAQPGGVYGPGDTSDLANLIDQVRTRRLKFKVFPHTGFNFVHRGRCCRRDPPGPRQGPDRRGLRPGRAAHDHGRARREDRRTLRPQATTVHHASPAHQGFRPSGAPGDSHHAAPPEPP